MRSEVADIPASILLDRQRCETLERCRDLSIDDVRLIVQFLNTLTGEYEGRPLAGSDSTAK